MRAVATTSLVAAAVAVAGFASTAEAQLNPSLILGLSAGCASGLVGLVTNSSVSQCLNLPTAVGALTSAGNNSLVPGLESYLNSGVCKNACTSTQLAQANGTLLQSCASDLQGSNGAIPGIVYYFINSYDRIRRAGCLQSSSGQSCLAADMYALQNTTQMPITFSSLPELLNNNQTQGQALEAFAANKIAFCTDCTHGLYSVLFPANSNEMVAGALNSTCGASFLDGQVPSSLKDTAAGNSTNASSTSGSSSSGTSSGAGSSSSSKPNSATPVNMGTGAVVAAFGSALAALAAGLTLL